MALPIRFRLVVSLLIAASACGDDGAHHLPDAPGLPDAPADAAIDSPDPMVPLDVTVAGAGEGTVTSSPAGITCANGTCSGDFDPNTVVTLTAVAETGSVFEGWAGGCSGTTPTCEVTLEQAASVTATFAVAKYAVTITKSGAGSGTVTGNGIDCGSTCTVMLDHGTVLSLAQTPANLSVFAGWGGACTGTAGCTTTITGPTTISANFALDNLTLFVTKGGNGAGTVTSAPAGINCGADCSESYTAGQMVTLTAAASTGSTFTGWSGACTGTAATCTVTVDAAKTATATFTLQQFALTVAKAGNGSGTVVSNPTGVACGADCTENYNYNTLVTLTATPSAGSTFAGWAGACTGTTMCVVTMTQARGVTATFTLKTFTLTAAKGGTGAGTITSSPAGISCGADCSEVYNYGQMVALTAVPAAGSTFAGWSGACTGTGTCNVTVDAAKSVTATFTLNTYTLTVTKAGNGTGTVTGTGISCGADCTETVSFGTMITLTATPSAGSTFAGWGGACTGTAATCTVTIDVAKSVTATFSLQTFTLTVAKGGNGVGTVTSTPAGISCGADCSEVYNFGQTVTLTATPATGSSFAGWSGACTGTGTCTVTMDAAKTVTATFTLMAFAVTVTKAGAGTGTVTSTPVAINCGAACSSSFNYGSMVTLTAAPAVGSTFAGWTGGGCSGTGTCTVAVTAAVNVTATFNVATFNLVVALAGTGSGTVTSSPAGITCPGTCTKAYNYNTSVTLTATPSASSDFAGWSGACTGTGACTVAMTAARNVTATFTLKTVTLSIKFSGDGAGTITANGNACTGACLQNYPYGTVITMSATPASLDSNASTFKGWTGGGCSGTGGCSFTLTALTQVDGGFKLKPNIMFVTRATFDGNLGGLAGGDAKCQAAASAAGLKGNYRAYLGSTGAAATTRYAGASGWVRTDGTAMINAIGEFGTITLPGTPSFDELGVDQIQNPQPRVWTATSATTAYFGQNCNAAGSVPDWTTTSARTLAGILTATDSLVLTGASVRPCAELEHLYCFGYDRAATVP